MKIPTEEKCREYFERYKVPKNIQGHCQAVQKVAHFIASKINERSEKSSKNGKIDAELASILALCHDMFKVVTIKDLKPNKFHSYRHSEEEIAMWKKLRAQYPDKYESEVGYLIFKDEYPEFAVALKNSSNPKHRDKTMEEAIVHYADYRVFREEVVSLNERFAYLIEAYPYGEEEVWDRYIKIMQEMEARIFSHLEFRPEELRERIKEQSGDNLEIKKIGG